MFVVDGGDVRVLRRVWAAVDRYADRRLCVFVVDVVQLQLVAWELTKRGIDRKRLNVKNNYSK